MVGAWLGVHAQPKPKLGLLSLDSYDNDPQHAKVARIELQKLGLYEMIDIYDVEYMIGKDSQNTKNCYGKLCLVAAGKSIKADKMLTGSIESFPDRIVISLRIIDVASEVIEKNLTMEFFRYPQEIGRMLEVVIKKIHDVKVDETLYSQIVRPEKYSEALNPPVVDRLRLSGPRLGFYYFTVSIADRLDGSRDHGGF